MRNLLALFIAAALLAACAHAGDMPTVRAGNDPDPAKARAGGRASGAGGSHAPGGTGLGSGTMGAESFSGAGSVR
ncbi:MAG TPA: hypothetical protein VNU64_06275 [Burkholderiales bacterium]|nr:hypothetical protein [Burkholderiales bacterium]